MKLRTFCIVAFSVLLSGTTVSASDLDLSGTLYGQDARTKKWGSSPWTLKGNTMRVPGQNSACPREGIRMKISEADGILRLVGKGCRTTWDCTMPVGSDRLTCEENRFGAVYVENIKGW